MPYINLIQEQRQEVKRTEQKARIFFLGFAASAVLSLASLGVLFVVTEAANGQASDLQAKAQRIMPITEDIEKANLEVSKLEPRLTSLEDARRTTARWNRILDHLTINTPQEVWLTILRAQATDPKAPVMVSMTGMATRQELIGEFMLRLQNCEDLEAVNLRFSQEKPVEQVSRLEFQIDANVVGTIEEKSSIKDENGEPKQ